MPHVIKIKSQPHRHEFNKTCPVCLSRFFDPRTLPCHHTYCVDCLQFVIDLNQRNPGPDRGFLCLVCRYFTKVLDESIPRGEWARELPWHFRTYQKQNGGPVPTEDEEPTDVKNRKTKKNVIKRKSRYVWMLDWRASGFPRSFSAPPGAAAQWKFVKHQGCYSKIQAATFYKDTFIVFDKGVSEIIIYNTADCKLKFSMHQADIYDLAVQGGTLYMTNPEGRVIHTVDMDNRTRRGSIKLTTQCYGIGALEKLMAVILCDNNNKYQISFLENNCVKKDGAISLYSGALEFQSPRRLAVCNMTSLMYVGDVETGIIKCYDVSGHMQWETNVFDAGAIATWYDAEAHPSCKSCLIIARKFTNSLDVLSGIARFDGRLESKKYGLDGPHVIRVNETSDEILVVDDSQMMHVFRIRCKYHRTSDMTPPSCVCNIL